MPAQPEHSGTKVGVEREAHAKSSGSAAVWVHRCKYMYASARVGTAHRWQQCAGILEDSAQFAVFPLIHYTLQDA